MSSSSSSSSPHARLQSALSRASEAEANMMRAAEYGRGLLERVQELEQSLERTTQARHELSMKLESKQGLEEAWTEELEHLRETVREMKPLVETGKVMERENESLRGRLESNKTAERKLEERVQLLETQLEEAMSSTAAVDKRGNNSSLLDDSLLENLRSEKVDLVREKQRLEAEGLEKEERLKEVEGRLREEAGKRKEVEMSLEEKECEVSSYCRKIDELRDEMQELQVEIEQLKLNQGQPSTKGNSLFSEVEDRRHLVEGQLSSFRAKYDNLKVQYDAKVQQLRKVKLHNVSLLSLTGGAGMVGKADAGTVKRLEEMLVSERNKAKMLMERISLMEGGGGGGGGGASNGSAKVWKDRMDMSNTNSSPDDSLQVKSLTNRSEFFYFKTLLADEKSRVAEFQRQLQSQMRQNLDDGDKMMEMSRKIGTLESGMTRLRAENYQLKIRLDEAKEAQANGGGGGESGVGPRTAVKKETKLIFEDIKFSHKSEDSKDTMCKKFKDDNGDKTCLENKNPNLPSIPSVKASSSSTATTTTMTAEGEKKAKKSVSISGFVECFAEDGEKKEDEKINLDEKKEKLKRPEAKKRHLNPVINAEEEGKKMQEQCAQQ